MSEHIQIEEFRCSNCLGMEGGEPAAYVNNSGWCKGCVMRLKHWWANLIPPKPNEPLKAYVALLMWSAYGGMIVCMGYCLGQLQQ